MKKEMFQHLRQQENSEKHHELEQCIACKKWREFCTVHGTLDRYNVNDLDRLQEMQPQLKLRS